MNDLVETIDKLSKLLIAHSKISKSHFNIIAATLDRKNNILEYGYNSYVKTHPIQNKYALLANLPHHNFLHAEIASLIKTKKLAHSIIVLRVNKQNKLVLAKPCPICMLAIKESKLKLIYYSVTNTMFNTLLVEV